MTTVLVAWLAVVAALVVVALAVLYGWQPERIRAGIEWAAVRLIDHEVRIDRLEGSLLDGLTLHGVAVQPVGEDEARSGVLRALRITVRVDGGASLRRRALVLSELSIVKPVLALSRTEEQGWRLAGWGPLGGGDDGDDDDGGGTAVLPITILLGAVQISDVHLSLTRDERSGLEEVRGRIDLGGNGLRLGGRSGLSWPNEGFARIHVDRAGWRGIDFGSGRLSARIRGPSIDIDEVTLAGPVGQLSASGAVEFAGPITRPRARHGDLRARLTDVDIAAIARPDADADASTWSRLSGDVDVAIRDREDGETAGFDLDWHAVLESSRLMGERIERAELAGGYRTGLRRWWVESGEIDLAAGRVDVSGEGVALRIERLEASARDVDLALLPDAWLSRVRLRGRADLDLALHGPIGDPIGTLEVSARALWVDDVGPGRLELALRSRGDRRYSLDELDWTFGEEADRLAGIRIQSLAPATLELGDGVFAVHDLALDWTGGSMRVDGGVRDGALMQTHVEIDALDLEVAARVLGLADDPGGVLSGSVDASGPLRDPDLRARLDWESPRYAGLQADHIELAVDTAADSRSATVQVDRDAREQLRVDARLPRPIDTGDPRRWLADPRTALDLEADALDLGWFAPLLAPGGLVPAGRIDGSLEMAGGAAGPTAEGELVLAGVRVDRSSEDDGGVGASVIGPIDGSVRFDGRRARTKALRYGEGDTELLLDAALEWSGPLARDFELSSTVTGVGFKGSAVLDMALHGDTLEPSALTFDDFEVAELARRAGVAGRFGGMLTGEIVVSGPTSFPDLRTKLEWRDPEVAGVRADLLVAEAHTQDHSIALVASLTRSGKEVLEATGLLSLDRAASLEAWLAQLRRAPTHPSTRLDVDVDEFPLDWLPVFAPGLPLKTEGFVEGHVTLRGADPIVLADGELTLEQAVFSLATRTASIGPLDGTVRFAGQRASFERLVLSAARGSAGLAGWLHWSATGIDEVSISVVFAGYRFDQLGLLQTKLDGRLEASGSLDALQIGGELELGEIRIAFPSQENPVLKEIRVSGLPDNGGSASIREGQQDIAGLQEASTVDIVLSLPRGTWVRGIGLDAEVVGEVRVTKSPGEPLHYIGRLEVEHGRYTLQGKRFQLDRGVAVFTGGTSPIPELDIEAHRQASREVTVYAHVTGPANAPKLELTSEPPMDTAEIISYLFFGRSATAGDRESRGLGVSAASVAGSVLIDSVAPELRDTLRIDEISVTSNEADGSPAVEIETQVTPDVYLRLIQSLGASADEAVEVRWRFWKGFSFKSKVSRSGTSSIDLLWQFDYWGLQRYGLGGFEPPPPPYRAEAPVQVPCRVPEVCPPPR